MDTNRIRLLAADCDGTLFSKHGKISGYGKDVLFRLKERGILVVICTGRPLYSIQRALTEDLYDYAVCGNGQLIAKSDGTVIAKKRSLTPLEIREITRLVEKHRVMMSCSYDDDFHHFTSKRHHIYVSSVQRLKNVARRLLGKRLWNDDMHSDYQKLEGYDIFKICFSGTPANVRKLADSIDPTRYSVQFTSSMWVEVQPYGVSKGEGLAKILEMEHIQKEECAAIGDGENDLTMFEVTGLRIAMKNAMPALKEQADFITEEHCIDDGAPKWIDANILQKHD